jgi:hypothetical protein
MKKRVRTQPTNPYYSDEPAVAKGLMADKPPVQNAALGVKPGKTIDKKPGRLSGFAGFVDKHKPKHTQIKIKAPPPNTASKVPHQGKLKMSGHPKAHRLGAVKPLKLKV